MFRLSARQTADQFDIWMFDDHSELHDGDPNAFWAWEDLLEGATTVSVEWARSDGNDPPGPIGQYNTYVVDLLRPQGQAKRILRMGLNGVPRDREYIVRFSIDGGPWLGPIVFRWGA